MEIHGLPFQNGQSVERTRMKVPVGARIGYIWGTSLTSSLSSLPFDFSYLSSYIIATYTKCSTSMFRMRAY